MTNPVTEAALRVATFELGLHIKLGRGGFIYLYKCREFPALTVKKTREKTGLPIVRTMYVGEQECATTADVVAALNQDQPGALADAGAAA